MASLQKAVSGILELPAGVVPLNLVMLGYPAEEKPARTQYDPELVYLDSYGTPWKREIS
jgi:nitroreductase